MAYENMPRAACARPCFHDREFFFWRTPPCDRNVIFPNVSRRSPIFEVSTLRDAEQAKNLVLNSPRILLNYKNGKICVSYPEDTLRI